MSVYLPNDPELAAMLSHRDRLLVVCYCAAWCDTCSEYRPKLETLSDNYPERVFVWVDIEDEPELLGDEDVENFPTILLEKSDHPLFFGTVLPHIGQLERLIEAVQTTDDNAFSGAAPRAVRQMLIARDN